MHSLFWLMWMLSHNTGHGFWRWLNYFSSLEGVESLLPYGDVKPCTRLPWEEWQQSSMSPLHPAVAGFLEPVSVNRHPCTAWGGQVSDENGWSLCSCCGRTCSEQTPCHSRQLCPSGPLSTWALPLSREHSCGIWPGHDHLPNLQIFVTHLSRQIMPRAGRNIPVNQGWSLSGEMSHTRLESSLAESDGVCLASSVWQRVAVTPISTCHFLSGFHPHQIGKGGGVWISSGNKKYG